MKTLTLPDDMVNILGEALAAQPYKIVAPILAEIQRQIDEQNKKKDQFPENVKELKSGG